MNKNKDYQDFYNRQKSLEKLSFKLIQFIDPTPYSNDKGIDTYYANINDKYRTDGDIEKNVDANGRNIEIEHIDIKQIIMKLNNPSGFIALGRQLQKNLDEDVTPEYWQNWSLVSKKDPNKVANKKVKRFLENLDEIEKINKDFYINLYELYIEVRSTGYDYLASEMSSLQLNYDELRQKISTQDKNIENAVENKIKSNVYSEFITILGIFTAITFAIFGGMNLLSNLFQNIGSTPASLGQTLILAAIFGLFMWGIIELLFNWISKIKEPLNQSENGKKEDNKKKDNKKEECLCPKVCRISFIKPVWIPLVVLLIMLGIGICLFIHQ